MFSHWSSSDSKSPQVAKTLLSILADLNHTVIWMLFSSSCFQVFQSHHQILGDCIIITFMFYIFFSSQARSRYLSLFYFLFNFSQWSVVTAISTIRLVLFLCWLSLIIIISSSYSKLYSCMQIIYITCEYLRNTITNFEWLWTDNLTNTTHDIRNQWTAGLTLSGLISCLYRDIPQDQTVAYCTARQTMKNS